MRRIFDFLVIGSGIAGLNFSLRAAKYGRAAIITKKELKESNSYYAQGGIAAALDKTDNFNQHMRDTLKAGCYLNDKKNVEIMVKEGPAQIKKLIKLGVCFNTQQNQLSLTQEGGHSRKRIVNAKDATGKELERVLIHHIKNNKNINVFASYTAVDLIMENKKCIGAMVLNDKDKIDIFLSKATILATGGAGQVYERNTNPQIATGDGIAMAYRARANIQDMGFVQFHPSVLDKKGKPAFLISESLRGEGAVLKNSKGRTFMKKYHSLKELAPRDIVSRAIFKEMKKGRVSLDIRHKGVNFIRQRFPYVYARLRQYGVKMEKDLIPVSPAAHYICGGVHTDSCGRTNIAGLYACGEVAHTGVHGANRLASNSLLECMVFSTRAAKSAVKYIKTVRDTRCGIQDIIPPIIHTSHPTTKNLKKRIQTLMWNNVSMVRNPIKMKETLKKLKNIQKEIDAIICKRGINKNIIELLNLNTTAILITQAALKRKKSIGTHYMEK